MKKLGFLTIAALTLAAAPALAAGHDWTGYYAGVNAGGGFGNADARTHTVFDAAGYFAASSVPAIAASGVQGLNPSGFTGGVQGGYNQQVGNIVYGLEGDFGYFGMQDSATTTGVYPCCGPDTYTIHQSVDTNWLATVRPRIGWATDGLLLYGTGGLSVTDIHYTERFTDTFATALETSSISSVRAGWNIGAGGEYALPDAWSLKGEYLYTDFGRVSHKSTNLGAFTGPVIDFPVNVFTTSTNLNSSVIRVGLNRKF